MPNCKITRDSKGKIIKVLDQNGNESKVFNKIASFPHVESLEQAVQIYDEILKLNPNELEKGFYSNIISALKNIKDKAIKNVKGWINQLSDAQKNGGIKNVNQEITWIGLEDYLNEWVEKNKPKNGNIPFEVIQKYVEDNQIEIVEVNKGKGVIDSTKLLKIEEELKEKGYLLELDMGGDGYMLIKDDEIVDPDEVPEDVSKLHFDYNVNSGEYFNDNSEVEGKYSEYTLGDGDNYREILLTIPNINKESLKIFEQYNKVKKVRDSLPYNSEERDIKSKQLETLEKSLGTFKDYKSSHWNESNVLAHIRLNNRKLPSGEKVLFIEEIQSDWAQDGKKQGFKETWKPSQLKVLSEEEVEVTYGKNSVTRFFMIEATNEEGNQEQVFQILKSKYNSKEEAVEYVLKNKFRRGNIPQMPYKKTDQWVGLAMRKVYQMAAQEGFDRIAWVTGEQSADRYDLSKQVLDIDVEKVETVDELFLLDIRMINGDVISIDVENGVVREGEFEGKNLEDIIGKDLSKKILKGNSQRIEGDGLKVGGEGMKTFYNSILPKVAKKEAQRFDKKAKVEVIDFKPKQRLEKYTSLNWSVRKNNEGVWEVLDPQGTVQETEFNQEDAELTATDLANDVRDSQKEDLKDTVGKQLSISITNKLKEKNVSASPLFSIKSGDKEYISFKDALKNTSEKTINIVSNGKIIASFPSTLDERTTQGVINSLIFDGVIKAEKTTYNGETFYTATGATPQQEKYTLEFFKEEVSSILPKRNYSVKNGLIKIKNVEVVPSKEGSTHRIISDAILGGLSQKTKISKKEKISERNLRLNLFSILNDMGISTLSLKQYQDRFKLKNKLSPSVEGLADIANRLVAFKGVGLEDGSIDYNSIKLEDLTEEVMHIIVETLPKEKLEEFSDFIKNSPEYQEHYEVYNEAYKGDQARLEKEILGKIMKNLTLSKTEGHPKSFLAKLVDIIEQFFDKLNITSRHFKQLKELNSTVEKFVIQKEETLSESNIQDSKDINLMYSLSDQVSTATEGLINTFGKLTEKSQFSSFKRQLSGLSLESATNKELALVTEKVIESTNKLIDSTEVALEEALKSGKGLSGQNKVMLEDLDDLKDLFSDLETSLSAINEKDLRGKNKLITKLKENNNIITSLVSKNSLVSTDQVKKIHNAVKSQLGSKEQDFADEHLEKAIQGQLNDVNFVFSFFGQLHHASNPIMNMIGAKIWEQDMMANQRIKEDLSPLLNYMDDIGFSQKQFAKMFDSNGHLRGPYKTKEFLDDVDKINLEVYNSFAEEKIDVLEEYKKLRREGKLKINELSEEEYGKYKIALQEKLLEVSEPIINPRYYRDTLNPDGTVKNVEDRKGLHDKYERLNINPETITFLKELSSSRAAIKNKARKEDGRIILSPQSKSELNSISKTRKTRKSIYSDITGLKKGLKIEDNYSEGSIPLNTGGYLTLNLNDTSNEVEKVAAKISYDIHKLDHEYINSLENKKSDNITTNLKTHIREIIRSSNYSLQEKFDLLMSNINVSLSKEFYNSLGEGNLLQNPELDNLNPGRESDLKTLRELSAKKAALISMNRNTSSPIEIDKMHETDMSIVREYTLTINALLRSLKLPENTNENIGVKSPNESYKNYLKNKGIIEGTAEELLELETSPHSDTSNMSRVSNAYNKLQSGVFLTESEENLMEKYKGESLLETKLNYAKDNLYNYFTRFAPEGYKTMKERYNSGEDILSIFDDIDNNPYLDVIVDNSLLDDSEVIRMQTFSTISGQTFEGNNDKSRLEDFLNKEKNGELVSLTEAQNNQFKHDLYDNGYILNPDYNKTYIGGFLQPKKGKYDNSEYKNYYGINNKGEATKNTEEFEVRRLYLETKEKAYKNMDSQGQDLYKPVQISKTTTEKIRAIIASNSSIKEKWSAIIELFKERLAYRIDDLAYGEKDFKKNKLLPKYYTRDLEDPNDVSEDHFMALTQLVTKASQYKSKKEVISDIESLQNILLKNKRHNRGKNLSNVIKMTESFIDSAIYGKTEQISRKFKIPGTQFDMDLAKVARSFTKYVSLKNLGFSLPIAVTGLTTGYITKKVEDFVGEKTNRESAKLAFKEYKNLMSDTASNAIKAKVNDNSKLFLIGQSFGEYDMTSKTRNAKFGPFQRLFSKSAMSLHAAADFPITPQVMLSILFDNRIIKGKRYNRQQFLQEQKREGIAEEVSKAEWKNNEGKSVYNYMNFSENGFTWDNSIYNEFPNNTKEQTDNYLNESKKFINTSMANQLSIIKGQIPQQMRVSAQRHAVGSMAMLHKGFASIIIQNKFKDRHLNYDTGLYEEGHYRTLGRLMNSIIGNPLKMMERKEDFKDFYKEPKREDYKNNSDFNEAWLDYELKVRNTKRIVKEMGVFLSITLIFSMIFAAAEDDDNEDIYMVGLTNYILQRTLNEAGTNLSFGITGDIMDTLDSPLVTLRSAQDFVSMWELFDGEEITRNKYKGLSKRQRYLVKNIPGAKALYDTHDAETLKDVTSAYKMYNKGGIDWATLHLYGFLNGK